MKQLNVLILASCIVFVFACNSGDDNKVRDHVWKEQTDTIDRARDAVRELEETAGNKRKEIEQQAQ